MATFSTDEARVLELALKQMQGTYDECLNDEGLTEEERQAFAEDLKVTNQMIDRKVWDQ